MRVVVDFDAARRFLEAEEIGDAFEQRLLRRPLRELTAKRLAGIVERVIDEVALFAALRDFDVDTRAQSRRQSFFDHRKV